jgi:very-short-patch-repair endonuclease
MEKRLWRRLRARQLDGARFRRQVPLGPFIADFVCLEAKLVIEVDGALHANATEYDARRTAWLEAHGWRVIQFWNNEVDRNLKEVLASIRREPSARGGFPPSRPSPASGGRRLC